MRSPITVAGRTFRTKAELEAAVRSVVAGYCDGERLLAPDLEFMAALVARHPRADLKIGPGVKAMWIAENPRFPGPRSRCFYVERTDGTTTDFSWRECVTPVSKRHQVLAAMRAAVEGQTRDFKTRTLVNGPVRCPDTGVLLTFDTSHVDHVAPDTFDKIAAEFLGLEGLVFDDIALTGIGEDNRFDVELTDLGLKSRWAAFHLGRASLELVSARANLSIRRTS